jgi:hypothetical protein
VAFTCFAGEAIMRWIRFLGRTSQLGLALVALNACAHTVPIRDLLDRPQEFDGRVVEIEGLVTQSAGLLGTGAYEVDDGTGRIYVIAQGQGVPRQGARTKAKGRFESVFSVLGRTAAAIVQGPGSG